MLLILAALNHLRVEIEKTRTLIEMGYTPKALLSYPWLFKMAEHKEIFPFGGSKGQQQAWCVRHAFYVPEDWQQKRLGTIILNRLDANIDGSLHDATYWLNEFEVPERQGDTVYKNHSTEMQLLYSLTNVSEKLHNKVPTKPNKYEELFSDKATRFVYEALL
ncbi:MAG: hypothetical protein AAB221_07605, partial [Bacteroidota bacterium]